MNVLVGNKNKQAGFTAVEFLVATVVFGIIVLGLMNAYKSLTRSYMLARQYNEIYTVLSACPEVDRALEFNSLSATTNCYPNNSFATEDGRGGMITYSPTLTVVSTSTLGATDPLSTVPDSKVINISVPFLKPYTGNAPLELRMLITRNGIAQS